MRRVSRVIWENERVTDSHRCSRGNSREQRFLSTLGLPIKHRTWRWYN